MGATDQPGRYAAWWRDRCSVSAAAAGGQVEALSGEVLFLHPQIDGAGFRLFEDDLGSAGDQLGAYPSALLVVGDMQIVDEAAPSPIVVEFGDGCGTCGLAEPGPTVP